MKAKATLTTFSLALMLSVVPAHGQSEKGTPRAVSGVAIDRTTLPIAEPVNSPITTLDARDAKAPPRFQVTAPEGAPNVLVILIDDMGFGMPSAFGGSVQMPTAEHLASQGLRYNRFHTTALCSPTRTALLSGRNHHTNNMGAITEAATASSSRRCGSAWACP